MSRSQGWEIAYLAARSPIHPATWVPFGQNGYHEDESHSMSAGPLLRVRRFIERTMCAQIEHDGLGARWRREDPDTWVFEVRPVKPR